MVKRRTTKEETAAVEEAVETQETKKDTTGGLGGGLSDLGMGFGFSDNIANSLLKVGNKQISDLAEAMKKILADEPQSENIHIIKLDRARVKTAFSLICLVHTITSDEGTFHSVYPILIEATGDFTSPKLETINTNAIYQQQGRGRVELMRVPSDAYDKVLADIIKSAVEKQLAGGDAILLDGCVLPKDYDTENEEHIRVLTGIALGAVLSNSMRLVGKKAAELNLAAEMRKLPSDARLEYEVALNHGVVSDELERPLYYNWVTSLNMRYTGTQMRSLNETNSDRLLSRTIGFTDVIPTVQNVQGPAGTMMQATRFVPHIVIDHMSNTVTPGWVMLNILSAVLIKTNSVRDTLAPAKDDPIHDPGVLNKLANLEGNTSGQGEPIDFFAPGVTQYDINNTLSQLLVPGAVISFDVDVFGPNTWAMSNFLQAATNSPRSEKARQAIISAASVLTNGAFPSDWAGNPVASIKRLPRGYWEDGNSERRDLREFGVLGVMNQLKDDLQATMEFVGAMTRPGVGNLVDEAKILETYKRFIPSATITGYIFRVTLDAKFIEQLGAAVNAAGFSALLEAPNMDQNNIGFQDITQYMANAVVGQNVAAGFAQARGATNIAGSYNVPGNWF